MIPLPIPFSNMRELPEPCIGFVCCASAETAALEFKTHYGEDPRAIYSYINSVTGHTSYYIPKAGRDMRSAKCDV